MSGYVFNLPSDNNNNNYPVVGTPPVYTSYSHPNPSQIWNDSSSNNQSPNVFLPNLLDPGRTIDPLQVRRENMRGEKQYYLIRLKSLAGIGNPVSLEGTTGSLEELIALVKQNVPRSLLPEFEIQRQKTFLKENNWTWFETDDFETKYIIISPEIFEEGLLPSTLLANLNEPVPQPAQPALNLGNSNLSQIGNVFNTFPAPSAENLENPQGGRRRRRKTKTRKARKASKTQKRRK
jgi:hypothetical protein